MSKKVTLPSRVLATEAVYIDALSAASMVGFRIWRDEGESGMDYLWNASMDLSDCGKKIEWSFTLDEDGLEKIQTAIAVMERFEIALKRAIAAKNKGA